MAGYPRIFSRARLHYGMGLALCALAAGCTLVPRRPAPPPVHHIEPLPLDEFGYLFPQPPLQPVRVPVETLPLLAPPAWPHGPPPQVVMSTRILHFRTPQPFPLNRAGLSRRNREALRAFVESLTRYHDVLGMRVTGHTDPSGTPRYNLWLSRMRAKSAALVLLALGADPRTLVVRGVGSLEPLSGVRRTAEQRSVDIEVTVRVPAR